MSVIDQDTPSLITDFAILQHLLKDGKTEAAISLSNELLIRSRGVTERNHLYEAKIRMERALIGAIDTEEIGKELRWCADRLNASDPYSFSHGLALLNLASWHTNKNELMMALATHADISEKLGHPSEILGLSRLESARILSSMGDYEPSMRHMWIARLEFIKSAMVPENLVSNLEWLDMALDDVNAQAPNMDSRIVNAKPRETPGNTQISSNPEDIKLVVEELMPIVFQDLSGENRTDIGLIIDASEMLKIYSWTDILIQRLDEIQDPRVLEALQS
ncbi:MAG: hypothetical protein ACKVI6_04255 [Candidatus Poseidoniales archaeon]|jgi:hypothetical protein|tara:strand:- start:1525 stop:2355 length:831 start_codon:yes stop_codon:yes gene_type:complete